MYCNRLEANTVAMDKHVRDQQAIAASRRKKMEHVRRKECAPNRKAKAKLAARIKDWDATMAGSKNTTGYHKPGSLNIH